MEKNNDKNIQRIIILMSMKNSLNIKLHRAINIDQYKAIKKEIKEVNDMIRLIKHIIKDEESSRKSSDKMEQD